MLDTQLDSRRSYCVPELESLGHVANLTACPDLEDPDGSGPLNPPDICDIIPEFCHDGQGKL